MYFPVAFFQFIWPLFLVIFKVLNFRLVSVVPINDITVGCSFIVYYRSALHILIIVVHVDIPLGISYPGRFHAFIHLTISKKVLDVLTGNNSELQSFIHALSLNETQSFVFIGGIGEVSKSVYLWNISETIGKSDC